MATIAAVMPLEIFSRQLTPGHHERIAKLVGAGEFVHVPSLDALRQDLDARRVEVLMTGWRSPRLDATVLDLCPSLRLVAHCAGTVRNVLDPALYGHGIRVTSSATANAIPVAEYLLSWILRWNKQLPHWERAYRTAPKDIYHSRMKVDASRLGNRDRVVGIVSASRVGRKLISLLRHFELSVLLHDPLIEPSQADTLGATLVDLPELMRSSDIVSINAPLLPATINLIGASELALMRDGSLLINTARGRILDHDALLPEVRSGRISAVLDVTDPEPLPAGSPFLELDNVFVTPHVAGSMGCEVWRLTDSAIDEIERFLADGTLEHELTRQEWDTAA